LLSFVYINGIPQYLPVDSLVGHLVLIRGSSIFYLGCSTILSGSPLVVCRIWRSKLRERRFNEFPEPRQGIPKIVICLDAPLNDAFFRHRKIKTINCVWSSFMKKITHVLKTQFSSIKKKTKETCKEKRVNFSGFVSQRSLLNF
jgi:hypothetical protein